MDSSPPIEYTLALQARAGDRQAVAELTSCLRARLFALAYAELGHYEDAHDALAAGLLLICRHIGELREPERVVGWMQSIVRNEARRLRREAANATLTLAETDAPTDAADRPEALLLRLDIERALRRLPDGRQAEALRQFYFLDRSIPSIAEDLAATPGMVKMWLHRGRRLLRAQMEGYGPMNTRMNTQTGAAEAEPETVAPPLPEGNVSAVAAVLYEGLLEPDVRQRIASALQAAGYAPRFLTPADLGEPGSTEPGPWDVLGGVAACVLVEPLGARSVFEYILLLRAARETAQMPVAVVTETYRPDPFRALAFHTLGVAGLASRDAGESLDCLFRWTGGGSAQDRERQAVVLFADDEARRAGQKLIDTEHLLLGLLRDAEIARLLRDDRNVSPERIAATVRERMPRGSGYADHSWRDLTHQARAALRFAREETDAAPPAGMTGVSAKTALLWGLAREPDGLAGIVLRENGIIRAPIQEP